jgi:NAD-dependent SIR2 family protein deacetylase
MRVTSKEQEMQFKEALKQSKRIIAVCGAGLSAASGTQ